MKTIEAMIDHGIADSALSFDAADLAEDIYDVVEQYVEKAEPEGEGDARKKIDITRLTKSIIEVTRHFIQHSEVSDPTLMTKVGTFESIAHQIMQNLWLTGQIVIIVREEDFKALKQKADAYDEKRGELIELVNASLESIDEAGNAIRVAREMVSA